MQSPWGYPWDPRDLLPPQDRGDGILATEVAWELMVAFFVDIIPQAWHDLGPFT